MDPFADAQRRIRHPRGQRCNNNTCEVPAACLVDLRPTIEKKKWRMSTRQVARKIDRSKAFLDVPHCRQHQPGIGVETQEVSYR